MQANSPSETFAFVKTAFCKEKIPSLVAYSLQFTMTELNKYSSDQVQYQLFIKVLLILTCFLLRTKTFFSMWVFLSLDIYKTQDSRGRRMLIMTPLYHFHPLHEYLDNSMTNTAESSPLHIASEWNRVGKFLVSERMSQTKSHKSRT